MAPIDAALGWLLANARPLDAEVVPIGEAGGRVLAGVVALPERPACPVAAIDGLAVRATDTEGAADYSPLPIEGAAVVARMPLPPGTDAVLPAPGFGPGPVVLVAVAPGTFVVPPGHDVPVGASLSRGVLLRPLHLALLAGGDHGAVPVISRPRVELRIPSASKLGPMLALLIAAEGGVLSLGQVDIVLAVSGSAGPISDEPHEFGMVDTPQGPRPGLTLPGDPVRCAILFALIAAPVLRRMGGRAEPVRLAATLARKISSGLGQFDAIPVRLEAGIAMALGAADGCGLLAAGGADGLLLVPENSEGYPAGATVLVHPIP